MQVVERSGGLAPKANAGESYGQRAGCDRRSNYAPPGVSTLANANPARLQTARVFVPQHQAEQEETACEGQFQALPPEFQNKNQSPGGKQMLQGNRPPIKAAGCEQI